MERTPAGEDATRWTRDTLRKAATKGSRTDSLCQRSFGRQGKKIPSRRPFECLRGQQTRNHIRTFGQRPLGTANEARRKIPNRSKSSYSTYVSRCKPHRWRYAPLSPPGLSDAVSSPFPRAGSVIPTTTLAPTTTLVLALNGLHAVPMRASPPPMITGSVTLTTALGPVWR